MTKARAKIVKAKGGAKRTPKAQNQALSCLEQSGKDLLDLLPTGVQVNDLDGLIVYANDRLCEILGLSREEVVSKLHIWDVVKKEEDATHLKLYLDFLIKHQPNPTVHFGLNAGPDGQGLPVKVDWDYIRNGKNEVVGFISLVHPHPSW